MDVKPGYKQTEVGLIPEDWEVLSLSERSKRITDGEHITPRRSNSGYYLFSARNILNGRINLSDVDYVGEDEYLRIRQRCNPETGDVLISCSGTVGRVATVPEGLECVMVRSAALVKPDPEKLDGLYVQYFLQSFAGQKQILTSLNQGAQANLFLNHIQGLRVALPPTRAEQCAIAAALSDVDALIAALDRLIAKKRDIKQAAMQELLTGKRRLPGFSGELPSVCLGELGSFSKGRGIKKDDVAASGVPCVRYGEIYTHYNDYIKEFHSFISEEIAKESQQISYGDLLFAGSGETAEEIGKCVACLKDEKAYAGGDIVIFSPNKQNSMYLGYLMNHPSIVIQKARMGQGDAVVHISAKNLAELRLRLPPIDEQSAITTAFSDMDAEISALEARREKTRALKQGMMQELLTGRIRLV